jgi:hypothetical protein
MNTRHAAACGASIGCTIGFAVALLFGLDLTDGLYRTAILTAGGAWMGGLLAWLNDLLPNPEADNGREKHS